MEVAAAIWSRHLPELALVINSSIVNEMLNSVSDSIDQSKLRPWLSHFVPSVISLLPSALPEIIMWADKKTRSLEKYNRKEWPQIGLDFARYLIDLFTVRESYMSSNCNQLYMSKNSHLHRLMALVQSITDLLELKTHHRFVWSAKFERFLSFRCKILFYCCSFWFLKNCAAFTNLSRRSHERCAPAAEQGTRRSNTASHWNIFTTVHTQPFTQKRSSFLFLRSGTRNCSR